VAIEALNSGVDFYLKKGGEPSSQFAELKNLLIQMSRRRQAEDAMTHNARRFRAMIENSMDIIGVMDRNSTLRYVSPSISKVLGYSVDEVIGTNLQTYSHPDLVENLAKVIQTIRPGRTERYEISLRHKNGTYRLLEASITVMPSELVPNQIVVNARDITERRQAELERQNMEMKVQQSQKLESLGVMAGGIAHDFNNLLMGIMGHAGLALMEPGLGISLRRRLHQIEASAIRAAELTNQLLAYSGRGKFQVGPLSLSRLVDEMESLLETVISKKAVLEHRYAADLPSIEGDATQLRQVIMNLITNASDALGDRVGTITIATGVMETGPRTTCLAGAPPEGPSVFLEVSDTGAGMDAETLGRVFDPFFTTKFTGRGLGLAAVLGIMRGHHGAIQVNSEPGQGTTFRLLFPRSDHAEARPAFPGRPPGAYQSQGLILVVDDEEPVRSVATAALEGCGFTILSATNGRDGLDAYRAQEAQIRAILLDLTMPIMSGDEVLAELRTGGGSGATVPVLLSSGYSSDDVAENLQRRGVQHFLQKPYSPGDLIGKIRACLGE